MTTEQSELLDRYRDLIDAFVTLKRLRTQDLGTESREWHYFDDAIDLIALEISDLKIELGIN